MRPLAMKQLLLFSSLASLSLFLSPWAWSQALDEETPIKQTLQGQVSRQEDIPAVLPETTPTLQPKTRVWRMVSVTSGTPKSPSPAVLDTSITPAPNFGALQAQAALRQPPPAGSPTLQSQLSTFYAKPPQAKQDCDCEGIQAITKIFDTLKFGP